ncbi:O-antigen ligase family protein [Legionella sp.]|uniref:O-antigen ligase family protein n=1 Tax=Legionella sp. TaxID=459 RepID=UPI0032209BAF
MDALVGSSTQFSDQKFVPLLLAATLFVLPLSSSAKSICLSLSVVAILLIPSYRSEIFALLAKDWCKAAISLFCLALAACLWSPASFSEKMLILEKYSKFLYLPILVAGFRSERARNTGLHAFLLAMLLTSMIAMLRVKGFLLTYIIHPDYIFRNHIMVGYMLDFAAYLSALFAYRQSGVKRLAYGLLFILFSYHVLFINEGRMGYIAYFMLMALLILQICSWRLAITGVIIICTAFLFVYHESEYMRNRLSLVVTEVKHYQQNDKDTPVGYRLQFYQFAYHLFNRHPYVGNGTGSFTYYFRTEKPVPSWQNTLLEPHNQYFFVATEFGLLGVIILCVFFFYIIRASWKLDKMRPIALAMLTCFLLGNLTDSLLLYSGSGYFFILFMALCLAGPSRYEK